MAVTKKMNITNATGQVVDSRDIGAEAQYIEVSRDANGDIISDITAEGVVVESTESLTDTLKNMQNSLIFDEVPTAGSDNPVKSKGLVPDTTLSPTSTKSIENRAVTQALNSKLSTYADNPSSWNTEPTSNSTKPVTSGGIKSALDRKLGVNDVAAWAKASTKPSYSASEVGAIASTLKGVANGVAELDKNGKVPSSQLSISIDNALSTTSNNPVQNKVITVPLNKTYKDDDTTEATLADGDYFPFYDVSASAKRKTLWSNIVSKIKTALSIQNVLTSTDSAKPLSANMGNALGKMVAPIETTTTASRAYATGQQFILNGILYRATANISSGGTINTGSGGNATTAADVTSQISNLEKANNVYPVELISKHSRISSTLFYLCHKSGHLFVLSGYIEVSENIPANTNFLDFAVTLPNSRLYIPFVSRTAVPYNCIMNADGYVYCESLMTPGIYIFTVATIIN